MAKESGLTGLADRYATALFDLAVERKCIDAVAADLAALRDLLAESADLQRLVRSPVLTRADQLKAMEAVLARAGIGDLVRNFVGVLADHRRLFVLAHAIEAFERRLAAHRGEVHARVTAAAPLTQKQAAAIKAALKKAIGGKVVVDAAVDPELMGGVVVRVGSRMVDASLRTKLQRLHLAMKGTG